MRSEFACRCGCGADHVTDELLGMLNNARGLAGIPFVVSSGVRCPAHNETSGGAVDSAHLTGHAADITVRSGSQRWLVVRACISAGFTRIGIGQTFVHVDCDETKSPRVIWTY